VPAGGHSFRHSVAAEPVGKPAKVEWRLASQIGGRYFGSEAGFAERDAVPPGLQIAVESAARRGAQQHYLAAFLGFELGGDVGQGDVFFITCVCEGSHRPESVRSPPAWKFE